jgi:hypothetical protein
MAGSGGASLTGGGGGGKVAPPKGPAPARGGGRGGARAPAAPHAGGKAGGKAGGAPANPLLDPNSTLQGNSLYQAAQGLTNAQTTGPITELAKQIAADNAQTAAAEKATAGYFGQLGTMANQGQQYQQQNQANLNSQLSGIGSNLQSQLQGIGNNTMSQMGQYSPGGSGLGSNGPGAQALATEIARQQGLAAQDQGAFRAAGANQGANYAGLNASNMGAYALGGQAELGKIGQAGQLKDLPLNSKIAGLQASKGALLASNIGKLRQQEISNQIAKGGLGLKAGTLAATVQNNQANQSLKASGQAITQQNNLANQAQHAADLNQKAGYDAASLAQKQAALNLKAAQSGKGGGKPLSTVANNTMLKSLDEMTTLIQQAHAAGHTGNALRTALALGQMQKGFPAQLTPLIDAAFELLGYGSIDQKTAQALHAMGLRGGTFRGAPIKVTANNGAGGPLPVSGSLGGSGGVGGSRNATKTH